MTVPSVSNRGLPSPRLEFGWFSSGTHLCELARAAAATTTTREMANVRRAFVVSSCSRFSWNFPFCLRKRQTLYIHFARSRGGEVFSSRGLRIGVDRLPAERVDALKGEKGYATAPEGLARHAGIFGPRDPIDLAPKNGTTTSMVMWSPMRWHKHIRKS